MQDVATVGVACVLTANSKKSFEDGSPGPVCTQACDTRTLPNATQPSAQSPKEQSPKHFVASIPLLPQFP